MIKKTQAFILIITITLAFCGCSDSNNTDTENLVNQTTTEAVEPQESEPINYVDYLQAVDSTCFESVGYDSDTETLVVKFLESGSVYTYSEVPEEEYDNLVGAYSIGGYYNDYIKGQYECERIE